MRKTMAVWIGVCLLSLTACSASAPRPSAAALLPPRPVPEWKGGTYRDLARYSVRLRTAALVCEADKAAARKASGQK